MVVLDMVSLSLLVLVKLTVEEVLMVQVKYQN